MPWEHAAGREDGQILPGLVMLLIAIVVLGIIGLQIGKAAILRSQAQTAADAAALAGANEVKRQLQAQYAAFGTTDVTAIDDARVQARMADYAARNDARLDPDHAPRIDGVDVRAWVVTDDRLGADAERIDRADADGTARARATLTLGAATGAGGSVAPVGTGGPGGPHISGAEWDALAEKIGRPPLDCPGDVITLGLFLKAHGFMVWQNDHPQLGGDAGHSYNPSSWHLKCNRMGALDVNWSNGPEPPVMDALRPHVDKLGFFTIWRAPDHYDHMHIDASTSAKPGGGGFAGPIDDVPLDVRLVDWDKELPAPPIFSSFPASGTYGGAPDLQIVALICGLAQPYGPKLRLAAFEAAIVESGVHNLNYGDADSHGVFQQQWSVGGWGTKAQTMDPVHATSAFLRVAAQMDRAGLPAGELAARVQRPREDLRGRYAAVEGQAQALIREHC